MRQDTAPIGEILESLASNEAPVYGIDSIPFLATGYDASKKLYAAQKPYLQKQLASEGLMLLRLGLPRYRNRGGTRARRKKNARFVSAGQSLPGHEGLA